MTEIKYLSCPFCGEDDFDLIGLKIHLTGNGLINVKGCEKFIELDIERKQTHTTTFIINNHE
jgi:hypothetical protein